MSSSGEPRLISTTRTGPTGFLVELHKNRASYLLALPALLYTFVFGYLTLPYMVVAFQRFSFRTGIFNSDWVGFKNFEFLFGSPKLWEITFNTLRINFLQIVFGITIAVTTAILLNEIRSKPYVRVAQSVLIFPHFLSWIIVSYIVYSLFATDYGVINRALSAIGLEPFPWYASPGPWVLILVFTQVWKSLGISTVIYLAAITAIDEQLYEAAEIDGASRLQKIFRITVPLLMPTVAILGLLSLGRMFYGDFGMIYAIVRDNGMLYETADVIDTYVFRALRKIGNPSQAMAVGLYQAVFGFTLVFGSNWLVRRKFQEGALF